MGSTESSYPSRSISPSLSSSDGESDVSLASIASVPCLKRSSLLVAVSVDSTNRFTWATPLPPSACLESPESSSSQFFPSYGSPAPASISPIDDFSFPLDLPDLYSNPLPLSSSEYYPLANTTLFETPSFYSALPLSPSKVSPAQLLIPRQDFDTPFPYQQKDTFLSSPSSISSSSSSYPSSLASFDPLDHPFALADELTFYHSDSSVPPSPPFSPSIEPAKNDFSHCFLPDANAFESLTLPMFQPHTSSSLW